MVKDGMSDPGCRLNRNDDAQDTRESPHSFVPVGAIVQTVENVLLRAAGRGVLDKGRGVVGSKHGHGAQVSGPGIVGALPDAFFACVAVHQDVDGRDLVVQRYDDAFPRLYRKVVLHLLANSLKGSRLLGSLDGNVEIEDEDALVRIHRIRDGRSVEFKRFVLHREDESTAGVLPGQLIVCRPGASLLSVSLSRSLSCRLSGGA